MQSRNAKTERESRQGRSDAGICIHKWRYLALQVDVLFRYKRIDWLARGRVTDTEQHSEKLLLFYKGHHGDIWAECSSGGGAGWLATAMVASSIPGSS